MSSYFSFDHRSLLKTQISSAAGLPLMLFNPIASLLFYAGVFVQNKYLYKGEFIDSLNPFKEKNTKYEQNLIESKGFWDTVFNGAILVNKNNQSQREYNDHYDGTVVSGFGSLIILLVSTVAQINPAIYLLSFAAGMYISRISEVVVDLCPDMIQKDKKFCI